MDVLNFYMPDIDWTQFNRGDVTKPTWAKFKDIILLCHAAVHWERELGAIRNSRIQSLPSDALNERGEQVFEQADDSAIHGIEMHMRRANFLATEKILEMGRDMPENYDGSPSAKLFVALRASVGIQANDGSAQCVSVCFTEFDARDELTEEPVAIVKRWQERNTVGNHLHTPELRGLS